MLQVPGLDRFLPRFLILATVLVASPATWADEAPRVRAGTDAGVVSGMREGGLDVYRGIPFAAAPVNELRWRAPQPVKAWAGERDASQFGADCAQKPMPGDAAPPGVEPAEDCLYLNVWAPHGARALPVMVWIYGGGFVNGGASPKIYDGAALARRGVVLVSFNYRVGRFGFFAHPALSAEAAANGEPTGNFAIMDQLAALRWVQRNIERFGGDPRRVTIFGESAGGASVLALLTAPLSDGLFARAIVQSGGGRGSLIGPQREIGGRVHGIPSGEEVGLAFARAHDIEGSDSAALAKLRSLPAEEVVGRLNMGSIFDPTYVGGPLRDGRVVLGSADELIRLGMFRRVPLMIGATSADLGFARWQSKDALFAIFGANAAAAREAYDPSDSRTLASVTTSVAGDFMMGEPARYVASLWHAAGLPVWQYRFSYVGSEAQILGQGRLEGAPHASELAYLFGTLDARYARVSETDRHISEAMGDYWVSFAKGESPTSRQGPKWPADSATAESLLDFTPSGNVIVGPDPRRSRLDLIETLRAGN
jgi:para-nitrobenzyl esterase